MSAARTILVAFACWLLAGAPAAAAVPQPVTACCFSPDGRSVVVARHGGVTVVSAADGREQRAMPAAAAVRRVSALAFSGDGATLAIAGGVPGASGAVVLCDWKTGTSLGDVGGFADVVTAVAFGPDGTLAVASADRSAALFKLADGGRRAARAAAFVGHAGAVLDIDFSPDGRTVVTASADRSVKVWERGGKLLRTLSNHTDVVHCLAIRPAPAPGAAGPPPWSCASGGDDRTVRVWQPGIGRMVRIVRKHEGAVLALAYAPDGARLFSAGSDGVVRAIDADGDRVLSEVRAHPDWVYALAVSPDGRRLASGDWAGGVALWNVVGDGLKREW